MATSEKEKEQEEQQQVQAITDLPIQSLRQLQQQVTEQYEYTNEPGKPKLKPNFYVAKSWHNRFAGIDPKTGASLVCCLSLLSGSPLCSACG